MLKCFFSCLVTLSILGCFDAQALSVVGTPSPVQSEETCLTLGQQEKLQCFSNLLYSQFPAGAQKQPNSCEQIFTSQDSLDHCHMYMALHRAVQDVDNFPKDFDYTSYCGMITDRNVYIRDLCYSQAGQDQQACDKIETNAFQMKAHCLMTVAIKDRDMRRCEQIAPTDYYTKDLCVNQVLSRLIVTDQNTKAKNPAYCKKIADPTTRQICLLQMSTYFPEQNFCIEIFDPHVHDLCIARLALSKKDPLVCTKINDAEIRSQCLKGIEQADQPPDTRSFI